MGLEDSLILLILLSIIPAYFITFVCSTHLR